MESRDRFKTKVLLGYALVILLLGGGLLFGIGRVEMLAASEMASIRSEHAKITAAEDLRWSGTALQSAGRGYLIAGTPSFLADMERAQAVFAQRLQDLLKQPATPEAGRHLARVEQACREYENTLKELIGQKAAGADPGELASRFDSELQPLRRDLEDALDDLVRLRSEEIQQAYGRLEQEQARWLSWARGLAAALLLLALGIAWFSARALARSHRREQQALTSARRALDARDQLLGMVAHDLRNALGAIAVRAAYLRKGADSERTRQQAESIESVALRMESLIKGTIDRAVDERVEGGPYRRTS